MMMSAVKLIVLTLAFLIVFAVYGDELLAIFFGGGLTIARFIRDRPINGLAVAGFLAGTVVLAAGVHFFASWVTREWQTRNGQLTTWPWRVRWTVALVALALTFFAAGVCMLGVTHQVSWLTTDPEGMYTKPSPF